MSRRLLTVGRVKIVDAGVLEGTTGRGATIDVDARECPNSAETW